MTWRSCCMRLSCSSVTSASSMRPIRVSSPVVKTLSYKSCAIYRSATSLTRKRKRYFSQPWSQPRTRINCHRPLLTRRWTWVCWSNIWSRTSEKSFQRSWNRSKSTVVTIQRVWAVSVRQEATASLRRALKALKASQRASSLGAIPISPSLWGSQRNIGKTQLRSTSQTNETMKQHLDY